MVPVKPHNLHFNFEKNVDGTFVNSEGGLYDAIINSSTSDPTTVVEMGPGGIGKTCDLEEIGRPTQEDKEKFKDGVLHVSMG